MNILRDPKWAWAAAAIVVCVGLVLLVLRVKLVRSIPLYYQAAATLPDEIKAAKQEGLPMTPADLVRPIAVPDSQNAALLYAQIGVNAYPKDDAYLMAVLKGKATDADRRATQRLLAKAAPQLHLAEQAAMLPDCDFHRNWSLGPDLLLPEYAPMRQTARLLAAQAMLQSEAGHPEAALHTIQVGAHMAQHVGKEPTIIAFLVRLAIEAIMDRVFQRIINKYADRPDILRMAKQTEQEFGPMPDIKNGLRGEVVMCRTMVDMLRKDDAALSSLNDHLRIPITGSPRSVVTDAYEAHSLSFWRRVFAAVNRTPDDPMATYFAFKAVNDAEEAVSTDKNGKAKPTYECDAILSPFFAGAEEKVVRTEAQRRLRRTLIALLAYRQREGHLPKTLADLSPAAPSDPYIRQPLHYRRTEKGFLLYSVGTNLTDDGGNAKPARKGELPPDIVTTFP